jgi:hypothetical protein
MADAEEPTGTSASPAGGSSGTKAAEGEAVAPVSIDPPLAG